jgi:serine/threonine protein kinase
MQKPCNYYDKYIKYKKKYIDYKNKLLDMKGGGINANIHFYTFRDNGSERNVNNNRMSFLLNSTFIFNLYIKITYIDIEGNEHSVKYRFIKKVGHGAYGDVYRIRQVDPVPEPGSPNFVIKLNIKGETDNMKEGEAIDRLNVSPSVKAIFQGKTGDIVYAIYNYLGQDLNTFFSNPVNLIGFTQEHTMSLIEQLHTQLHTLNSNRQYHNDVKIDNIVMRKTTDRDKYELSLIDYGLITRDNSDKGSLLSMCIRGCATFLRKTDSLHPAPFRSIPLFNSISTDYVGFFYVVIFLLNPKIYNSFDIHIEILGLTLINENWYTSDNICKVLCLLCYVSGCSDKTDVDTVDEFLGNYPSIVTGIETVLKGTKENLQKFTSVIPGYVEGANTYRDKRLLFLCFIYSKIIEDYGAGYPTIIPLEVLPLFLWRLSCCFDFRFNLEQFNTNFSAIFTPMSLKTFLSVPANIVGFTQEQYASLIGQLHTQLHILNSTNRFHNDVKIDNIVMYKLTGSDKYELSLIDSEFLSTDNSGRGSFQSMCIRGCAQSLYDMYTKERVNTSSISPLFESTSTDYVGFFYVVVFLLNPTYKPFVIYREILGLTPTNGEWHTSENTCKVLCLLCYVSGCIDERDIGIVDAFLSGHSDIVTSIDDVLKSGCTGDNLQKFTSVIPEYVKDKNKYTERRLLFLCFIYSKIIVGYGAGYNPIVPIEDLLLSLWRFNCCFNFRFNLEQFHQDMGTEQ